MIFWSVFRLYYLTLGSIGEMQYRLSVIGNISLFKNPKSHWKFTKRIMNIPRITLILCARKVRSSREIPRTCLLRSKYFVLKIERTICLCTAIIRIQTGLNNDYWRDDRNDRRKNRQWRPARSTSRTDNWDDYNIWWSARSSRSSTTLTGCTGGSWTTRRSRSRKTRRMNEDRALSIQTHFRRMDDAKTQMIVVTSWKSDIIRVTFVLFPTLIIQIKIELTKIIRSRVTGTKWRFQIEIYFTICVSIIARKLIQKWVLIRQVRRILKSDSNRWWWNSCRKGGKRKSIRVYLIPGRKWHESESVEIRIACQKSRERKKSVINDTSMGKVTGTKRDISRYTRPKDHSGELCGRLSDIRNRSRWDNRRSESDARLGQGIKKQGNSRKTRTLTSGKTPRNHCPEIPERKLMW